MCENYLYSMVIVSMWYPVILCPRNRDTWIRRSREFGCKAPMQYHCGFTEQGILEEFCRKESAIKAKYCPTFNLSGSFNVRLWNCTHGKPLSSGKCNQQDIPKIGYTTVDLYKYNICFLGDTLDTNGIVSLTNKDQSVHNATITATYIELIRASDVLLTTDKNISAKKDVYRTSTVILGTSTDIANTVESIRLHKESSESSIFHKKEHRFQNYPMGISIGVAGLVLFGGGIAVSYLLWKNKKYRNDVYFFKYHTNFDIHRPGSTVYDEINDWQIQRVSTCTTPDNSQNTTQGLVNEYELPIIDKEGTFLGQQESLLRQGEIEYEDKTTSVDSKDINYLDVVYSADATPQENVEDARKDNTANDVSSNHSHIMVIDGEDVRDQAKSTERDYIQYDEKCEIDKGSTSSTHSYLEPVCTVYDDAISSKQDQV